MMERIRIWASRFTDLFRSSKLDRELQEELEFHLDMQTEENICKGMKPEEARRSARISLGGITQIKEDVAAGADFLYSATQFKTFGFARDYFCEIGFSLSQP